MVMSLPTLRRAGLVLAVSAFALAGLARGGRSAAATQRGVGACGAEGRARRQCAEFASPRHQPPSSTVCPQTRPRSRRSICPAEPSISPRPPARSACSTTRASRWPTSPHLLRARWRRPRDAPGDVPVQRRARRLLGMAPVRCGRAMAAAARRRGAVAVRLARGEAERGDLARLHRSRLHRSRRHRLQPSRRERRGCAQAVLFGRRRRQFDCARDPPLAREARPADLAEICRGRKLWRHSRAEGRAPVADSSMASASGD